MSWKKQLLMIEICDADFRMLDDHKLSSAYISVKYIHLTYTVTANPIGYIT